MAAQLCSCSCCNVTPQTRRRNNVGACGLWQRCAASADANAEAKANE